jgi:hypothetical protein
MISSYGGLETNGFQDFPSKQINPQSIDQTAITTN